MHTSIDRQNPMELSAHTENPTLRSHSKYTPSVQIQLMRQREEFKKQLEICYREIETLKDEVHFKGQKVDELEAMNLQLRNERNSDQRKFLSMMGDKEKAQRQAEKLRNDNQSMEMELRRYQDQRKATERKIYDMRHLKEKVNDELMEKNKIIEEYLAEIKKNDKKMKEYKLSIQELSTKLSERERALSQLQHEYKFALQNHLSSANEISRLQAKVKDSDLTKDLLSQRINELQNQRDILSDKLEEMEECYGGNESNMSQSEQISMMEIQSLMTQMHSLINRKNEQKCKQNESKRRLKASIECLSRAVKN